MRRFYANDYINTTVLLIVSDILLDSFTVRTILLTFDYSLPKLLEMVDYSGTFILV